MNRNTPALTSTQHVACLRHSTYTSVKSNHLWQSVIQTAYNFERFNLYDLETNTSHEFNLTNFTDNVHLFGFIAGYQKRTYKEQDPVNIEAAALMGKLHDKLEAIGYTGHHLELYLVRLLFCLFADDTNIFEKGILQDYIEQRTAQDGSDLASHLAQLFEILNTPKEKRYKNLDESLAAYPTLPIIILELCLL